MLYTVDKTYYREYYDEFSVSTINKVSKLLHMYSDHAEGYMTIEFDDGHSWNCKFTDPSWSGPKPTEERSGLYKRMYVS